MNKLNFTGQLVYFDYQQHDCAHNYHQSLNIEENSSLSRNSQRHTSYYRSTLSFRHNPDSSKSVNSSFLLNNTNTTFNFCHNKIHGNDEYFSFTYFNSQLSKSSQLYARSLFDSLNLIIRILTSNLIHCKTYRLKQLKPKQNYCQFADVNIYSTRKSSSNQFQLIGRYSTMNNQYQSCHNKKSQDLSSMEKSLSGKIYYITSLFDEPFLMLRKRTNLHEKYNYPQANLKELRGQIFHLHELEGFCVDLAEKVCSILNITCQFRIVEDELFGSKNLSTGIWNGKELQSKNIILL
jgi:hypothetical protein